MTQHLFIGVDGGATKTIVRVEDESGNLLGQAVSGPANIRLSVELAWQSVNLGLEKILQTLTIDPHQHYQFHAGMGLAGCEMVAAYQAFLRHPHIFSSLIVTSDSHTACLGAHQGEDGAIIIAGTGVVGFQIQAGEIAKVGGWGFPHDDVGGGAWLGLEATKVTLQWLDNRLPASALAKAIYAHFSHNIDHLVSWTNRANSTAFAELAPIVIEEAEGGDPSARDLLKKAAKAIDQIDAALVRKMPEQLPLPVSLLGGVAPFLEPYLSEDLRSRLRPSALSPDAGAVLLVRDYLAKHKDIHG